MGNLEEYNLLIQDKWEFKRKLLSLFREYPELFPPGFEDGFQFRGTYTSKRLDVVIRRIRLKSTKETYAINPSIIMPYCISMTDDAEKPMYLRRWAVPFEALNYVFGKDPKHYERMHRSLGRPSLLGTTVKNSDNLPRIQPNLFEKMAISSNKYT